MDRYQELQALTNRKPSQGVFLGRASVCTRACMYIHTDATILGDACTHWLSGPEDFFNISPRRCSLHLQTRIVYLSGLTLVTNCGPSPRAGGGEGSEGCTTRVKKIAWTSGRGAGYGTKFTVQRECTRHGSRVATKLSRFCWLFSLSLSFYLSLSLSRASCSTADLPATGFCLPALLSSLERKRNAWNSLLRRSGLIGTSLISRVWGPPPLELCMYVCILLTSFPCNDENAFAGSKGMLLRESSPFWTTALNGERGWTRDIR